MLSTGNETVDAIGQLHLEGNIIPHTWYNKIKMPNGKPDVISIILLADLVYWYRPTYIRDEVTGQLLGTKKKFKGDLLQKKTQALADQFGFTKRQVQDALSRLEKSELIKRELRNFNTEMGYLSNVQFIGLNVENIKLITFWEGACVITHEVETLNVSGRALKMDTYTEITTEITTKNTTKENNISGKPDNAKYPYETIINYLNEKAGTKYRHNSQKTQQLIRSRYNEGFSTEDFQVVIDKKIATWLNHPEMNKYLRPETLFGPKFEGYLNEKAGVNNAKNQYGARTNHGEVTSQSLYEQLERDKIAWGKE